MFMPLFRLCTAPVIFVPCPPAVSRFSLFHVISSVPVSFHPLLYRFFRPCSLSAFVPFFNPCIVPAVYIPSFLPRYRFYFFCIFFIPAASLNRNPHSECDQPTTSVPFHFPGSATAVRVKTSSPDRQPSAPNSVPSVSFVQTLAPGRHSIPRRIPL